MDKRLAKRHKRQVSRERSKVKLSEPDLRTPEQIEAAREASRASINKGSARSPRPPRLGPGLPQRVRDVHRQLRKDGRLKVFSARCPYCRSVDLRSVGVRNAIEQAIHWIPAAVPLLLCAAATFFCSAG